MKTQDLRVLVVGANGALATETIKALLREGVSKIVMACRTHGKGIKARESILSSVPKKAELPVVGGFDMTDPQRLSASIKDLREHGPFDVVFLAAGFAVFSQDYEAVEWRGHRIEKNVFQNMVGSHLTFVGLKEEGLLAPQARIVLAGGEGARGIPGMIAKPDFPTAESLRDYVFLRKVPTYNPMNAIGISKLLGALWTRKLSQLDAGVSVIWFSPGLTSHSAGLNDLPVLKRWFMGTVVFGLMGLLGRSQTPDKGGQKFADCLLGRVGSNGSLLGAPQGQTLGPITDQTPMNEAFSNEFLIEEFWAILEQVCGPVEGLRILKPTVEMALKSSLKSNI